MTKERIQRLIDLNNNEMSDDEIKECNDPWVEMDDWNHDELCDYLAQLYWIALTTGDWDAKWAVMVSLWGVG